jgi:Mg-chelatase subunit ChlD
VKRLILDPPKWHLIQHREYRDQPLPSVGDDRFDMLEDEVFERLYTGDNTRVETPANPRLRSWAERVHATLDQLPPFARLSAECRGNVPAAATAVETLMKELSDDDLLQQDALPPQGKADPLRLPAVRGCQAASTAVEELLEATEGLALFGFAAGSGTVAAQAGSGDRPRSLAARLRDDPRLRRIALLAGRMKRIAASKRRQRVKHGADEITDIEQGAELGRALPSELAKLTHPRRRLEFMRSFLERQVLQYQLVGSETLGKGPFVVLLDKSSSMDGRRDEWATALALALLEHAATERRRAALVDFNGSPIYEASLPPGGTLPTGALFVQCAGGTSIAAALQRGLDLCATDAALRKADIVLVTDGGSDATEAPVLRARAKGQNVTILGLAIGLEKDVLSAWCDEAHGVTDLSTVETGIADALFTG